MNNKEALELLAELREAIDMAEGIIKSGLVKEDPQQYCMYGDYTMILGDFGIKDLRALKKHAEYDEESGTFSFK